jgi:hypothetical protein
MRSYAASCGGVAHHHVVDSPVGYEPKRLEQCGDGRDMMIDRLDKQRPRLLAKLRKTGFSQGPVL